MPAKPLARESDMVDNAGIGLLLLIRRRDIDEMDDRLAFAVHPGARKREVRPVAFLQSKDILIELNSVGEFSGPDIEVIEHAYAHADAFSVILKSLDRGLPSIKQYRPAKSGRCPS